MKLKSYSTHDKHLRCILQELLICSEFCNHKNQGLDITPEEVPQGDSFDFVLVPARPEADAETTEQEASVKEAVPEKKESKGMIV